MSNNPEKIAAVQQAGIEIVERVSIEVEPHEKSLGYMKTKKERWATSCQCRRGRRSNHLSAEALIKKYGIDEFNALMEGSHKKKI